MDNRDIFKFCNENLRRGEFPNTMKMAEITPSRKKEDRTKKENYRPLRILPSDAKVLKKICMKTKTNS